MPQTMKIEIRRQDDSVEESITIGDREPAADIAARLVPLSDTYAGTGYRAVLCIPAHGGHMERLVGVFHA